MSPSQSADVVTDAIVQWLLAGKPELAVAAVKKMWRTDLPEVDPFKGLELSPSTMMVPVVDSKGIDPVKEATSTQVAKLSTLYSECLTTASGMKTRPFHVTHNVAILKNLLGQDTTALFDVATPTTVMVDLIDTFSSLTKQLELIETDA